MGAGNQTQVPWRSSGTFTAASSLQPVLTFSETAEWDAVSPSGSAWTSALLRAHGLVVIPGEMVSPVCVPVLLFAAWVCVVFSAVAA